jgi:hypothetical protein
MPRRARSHEWWFRFTLRALAASFAVVGAVFVLFPDATVRTMNAVGNAMGDFTPAPASEQRFWLSLATGYMVLVTALAYLAQRDLRRNRSLLALLALGKATSSLTCLVFYLLSSDAFLYLANFLIDGTIAATVLAMWVWVPSLDLDETRSAPDAAKDVERVLAVVVEAMIPAGGPFAEGGRGLVTLEQIQFFLAPGVSDSPRLLRIGLSLLELSPFLFPPFHWRRFSQLPLAQRVELLEQWERSRLAPCRQAVHVLKLLVMSHFYSRPEVAVQLRYPHPLERVPRSRDEAA